MSDAKKERAKGFTLIELLVVVAIMMVLIGMIMGAVSLVHAHRMKLLAHKQVRDIADAAEAYFMMMHQYPPDTGWVEADGSTTEFPTYGDPADANAIFMYLGRKVYEPETDTKYGNFLVIHPTHLRKLGGVEDVMVDPYGMPYCMDCLHVSTGTGAAVAANKTGYVAQDVAVARLGPPYPPGTPVEDQTQTVKVWSAGPDKKEGAVPFSHVIAPTAPEDEDNIASWR